MTPAELIALPLEPNGTMAEKLKALQLALADLDVGGLYRPPRCACGTELSVWPGLRSGLVFIRHPELCRRPCPRQGFRAWGPDGPAAMRAYIEKAPDLGALDAAPPDADEDNEFASEFQ